MSRTYRRLGGDQSTRNYIFKKHVPLHWQDPPPPLNRKVLSKEMARELAQHHSDSGWPKSVPSWFVLEFEHVPRRALTRQLLRRVLHLNDLEDAPLFPVWNRPSVYYD